MSRAFQERALRGADGEELLGDAGLVCRENAERTRRSLLGFSVAFVLLYLFAMVWAPLHRDPRVLIKTIHPFTWGAGFNFSDLTDYVGKLRTPPTAHSLTNSWPVFNYPPTAAYVYYALLHTRAPVLVFVLLVVGSTLVLLGLLLRVLWRLAPRDVAIAACIAAGLSTVFSFPMQYALWRGNLEGIAWIAFSWGFLAFLLRRDWVTSVLWGLGLCIKPFPILLFGLLVRRRKYVAIGCGLAVFAALQLLALRHLGPSVMQSAHDMQPGFALYNLTYVRYFRFVEARFQHSLLDSMKAVYALCTGGAQLLIPDSATQRLLFHVYVVSAGVIGTLSVVRAWFLPLLNQVLIVTTLIVVLAPVSADYTLLLMHLPFAAYLLWLLGSARARAEPLPWTQLSLVLAPFVLLFVPVNWLSYYSGVLRTVALFWLLAIALTVRFDGHILPRDDEGLQADASAC